MVNSSASLPETPLRDIPPSHKCIRGMTSFVFSQRRQGKHDDKTPMFIFRLKKNRMSTTRKPRILIKKTKQKNSSQDAEIKMRFGVNPVQITELRDS